VTLGGTIRLSLMCYPEVTPPWETKFANQHLVIPREVTFFKCPTCSRCTQNTACNFRRNMLDLKIKCGWCKKTHESATWTCACDLRWFTCTEHRAYQKPLQSNAAKRKLSQYHAARSKQGKTLIHTAPVPHVLLQQDIARYEGKRRLDSSAKDEIVLGNAQPLVKRPRLLGPILSKRFAPN
jgi:hypothetical protein